MKYSMKSLFSYNSKNGNILWNDKRIVHVEKYCDGLYFYVKEKGAKRYLVQAELVELAKTVKWLIEQRGCDFGEELNRVACSYHPVIASGTAARQSVFFTKNRV